jgi:hypothetical protein
MKAQPSISSAMAYPQTMDAQMENKLETLLQLFTRREKRLTT